jgi:hypothetical protein
VTECSSRTSYGASGDLVTKFRKKIFFFLRLDIPSMSNPGGLKVFRYALPWLARARAAQKARRFDRLARMRRLVASHNEILS